MFFASFQYESPFEGVFSKRNTQVDEYEMSFVDLLKKKDWRTNRYLPVYRKQNEVVQANLRRYEVTGEADYIWLFMIMLGKIEYDLFDDDPLWWNKT